MRKTDIVIIGGGPAGMAAAVAAHDAGTTNILIIERDEALGGILRQCIHNGFGLHRFGEELTGPEYAARYAAMVEERKIPYVLKTMVLSIEQSENGKIITAMNSEEGIFTVETKAVVLAMGCRERPRGALNIPGTRPAGIYTAGTAQRYVNMKGMMPGKEIVILGSGDIGLIMARRMTLEGAKVKAVCELMPYSGGLNRNIVQCLNDFDIPLKLSHTVAKIHGTDRVTGVTIAKVDKNLRVIPEESEYIPCDTLLLSCGLLPENELSSQMGVDLSPVTGGAKVDESLETSIDGVFACGNVLHVHDLVDYVSKEASEAGRHAAEYVLGEKTNRGSEVVNISTGNGVRYTVPVCVRKDRLEDLLTIRFRVGNVYKNPEICVYLGDKCIQRRKKQICAPGEMEQVILKKADILAEDGAKEIKIAIETN